MRVEDAYAYGYHKALLMGTMTEAQKNEVISSFGEKEIPFYLQGYRTREDIATIALLAAEKCVED